MKCLSLLSLFFLISSSVMSQQFFIKLQGGFGLGTGEKNFISINYKEVQADQFSYDQNRNTFSFGNGIQMGGTFGYFINSNIGAEIEFQYSASSSLTYNEQYSYINTGNENGTIEMSGSMYSFYPSVLLFTDISILRPYLKVGAIIAFPHLDQKVNYNIEQQKANLQVDYRYSGGMALGFNSAIGTQIAILRNIAVNVEISNKNIFYSPDERKMEKYLVNGVTRLEQISLYNKQVEYGESSSHSSTGNNSNQTSKEIAENYSFSSLGVLVGVVFTF